MTCVVLLLIEANDRYYYYCIIIDIISIVDIDDNIQWLLCGNYYWSINPMKTILLLLLLLLWRDVTLWYLFDRDIDQLLTMTVYGGDCVCYIDWLTASIVTRLTVSGIDCVL